MSKFAFTLLLLVGVYSVFAPNSLEKSAINSYYPSFSLGNLNKGDQLTINLRMIHPKFEKDDNLWL